VRACNDFVLQIDEEFDAVLQLCASPPDPEDGVWITARMMALYRALHREGFAHSLRAVVARGRARGGAPILANSRLGRAVMLESMRRLQDHAGNALLVATLDLIAARGATVCDIQLPTPHTLRLGCRLIDQDVYEQRVRAAVYDS